MVNYWDKYTEMHGQQNIKITKILFGIRVIQNYQNNIIYFITNTDKFAVIVIFLFQDNKLSIIIYEQQPFSNNCKR